MSVTKVFLSNLNYSTTEDELKSYLGEEASNVFIPNYFFGFRNSKVKPLGIGYADLPSLEAAEEFTKRFDGETFKDRKLRVRLHVPYVPESTKKTATKSSSLYALSRQVSGHKNFKAYKADEKDVEEPQFSTNSIFLRGLKAKTSESSLREFFKDYNPTEVKIQKLRGWIRGFKNRAYNAIVVLDLPPDKSIDEVIEESKSRKHEWSFLNIVKAYSKEKKSPANSAEPDAHTESEAGVVDGCTSSDGHDSKEKPSEAFESSGKEPPVDGDRDVSTAGGPADEGPALEEIKSSAENVVFPKTSDTGPSEAK